MFDWRRAMVAAAIPVLWLMLGGCSTPMQVFRISGVPDIYDADEYERKFISMAGDIKVEPPLDRPLVLTAAPVPDYPLALWRSGFQGVVSVRYRVADTGVVDQVESIGPPVYLMTQSLADAVSRRRFEPPVREGKPVSIWLSQTFEFSIRRCERAGVPKSMVCMPRQTAIPQFNWESP